MEALLALAQRFKEPSSWGGIAALAGMLGINLPVGVAQNIAMIGAGICGLVAIFVPEKKS